MKTLEGRDKSIAAADLASAAVSDLFWIRPGRPDRYEKKILKHATELPTPARKSCGDYHSHGRQDLGVVDQTKSKSHDANTKANCNDNHRRQAVQSPTLLILNLDKISSAYRGATLRIQFILVSKRPTRGRSIRIADSVGEQFLMLQLPNVFLLFESDTRFTIVGAGSYNHTTRRSKARRAAAAPHARPLRVRGLSSLRSPPPFGTRFLATSSAISYGLGMMIACMENELRRRAPRPWGRPLVTEGLSS
jgi:hypothetical protein